MYFVSMTDKNLSVSISGDVDEAKALSKPPEDSQGTNMALPKLDIPHISNKSLWHLQQKQNPI